MASDSDSDEDFVSYGTPLEPLEEDEPARKPVPVHEQTVKDEKGRYKRFHGAFTGGFSAGYFNTVGSKEGWTPSTFVSSRQQKVERQSARPEDFMDEEDLGEHGIAPDQITTTADFGSGCIDPIQEKARTLSAQSGPIPGDTLLHDLIAPARTSVGVALLRKMGWREGQGVGPRVRKRKMHHKADAGERVYGCALPPEGSAESEGDSDDEFAPEDVTFAPRDVTPQVWVGKQDLHGLGYRGLDPSRALPAHTSRGQHINLFTLTSDSTSSLLGLSHSTHTRRGVAGQAFDEDDESVYHRDSMSNYDSVLGGEEPGDGLYGWTAPQQYRSKSKDSKRDAAYLGKILEGFTLASNAEEPKTVFAPPVLPRDYRPLRRYRPLLDTSGLSPLLAAALRDSRGHMTQPQQAIGRHQLDSAQRRELLGETSLQGPSSVFELLRPEDQEKLSSVRKAADGRRDVPEPSSQSGGPPEGRRGVPDLTSQSGRAAVVAAAKASALQALSSRFQGRQQGAPEGQSGAMEGHKGAPESQALAAWSAPTADTTNTFKPFDKNPHKQARYDQYVSLLRQGHKDALERSLDVCMTEWERGREREEFVRAALLYKPSSSALSTRFTRSTHTEDDSSVEVTQDAESDVNDKESAVKMKMFGKLTRDTFQWYPHTLLCKRFNIPDPYPGSGVVGMPKVKRDRFSVFNFLTVNESPTAAHSPASSSSGDAECSKAAEAGRRSRWDVTAPPAGQEDPLTQLLTQARNQASVPTHTHTTAEGRNPVLGVTFAASVMTRARFQSVMTRAWFQSVMTRARFQSVMTRAWFQSVMTRARFQSVMTRARFQSVMTRARFQSVMTRARFQSLLWNIHLSDLKGDQQNDLQKGKLYHNRLFRLQPLLGHCSACSAYSPCWATVPPVPPTAPAGPLFRLFRLQPLLGHCSAYSPCWATVPRAAPAGPLFRLFRLQPLLGHCSAYSPCWATVPPTAPAGPLFRVQPLLGHI
ncbi:hypothetical protein ACEWY4_027593 [Coilia grayii]|uniref:G-patch domain-containing protein n=1 Tax=Coilia grayii TaxID=363190 RepID=A0ABD1IPN5_9TELE